MNILAVQFIQYIYIQSHIDKNIIKIHLIFMNHQNGIKNEKRKDVST